MSEVSDLRAKVRQLEAALEAAAKQIEFLQNLPKKRPATGFPVDAMRRGEWEPTK